MGFVGHWRVYTFLEKKGAADYLVPSGLYEEARKRFNSDGCDGQVVLRPLELEEALPLHPIGQPMECWLTDEAKKNRYSGIHVLRVPSNTVSRSAWVMGEFPSVSWRISATISVKAARCSLVFIVAPKRSNLAKAETTEEAP